VYQVVGVLEEQSGYFYCVVELEVFDEGLGGDYGDSALPEVL